MKTYYTTKELADAAAESFTEHGFVVEIYFDGEIYELTANQI